MNGWNSIVLICDDDYVMPTSVAIASIIKNKKTETKYRINIVAASLSEQSEELFKRFEKENIQIIIIRQDANRFQSLHIFKEGADCVASISALIKFVLPELLPSDEKTLYLDGDILVKIDLSELYHTNIDEYLAGVVIDSGNIYYKHPYTKLVEHYFNAGVMLLNLKKFREEDIAGKLIETKKNMHDSNLMDQNAFNLVLNGRIKCLPIRYNLLAVNLNRADAKWNIENINEIYNTNYESKKELFSDGVIIHYSSKDKPWKVATVPFAADWYEMYLELFSFDMMLSLHSQASSGRDELESFRRELQEVYASKSFRIGRFITFIPRKIRGAIRCYREHGMEYTLRRIKEKLDGLFGVKL